jgi:hypothetical protein
LIVLLINQTILNRFTGSIQRFHHYIYAIVTGMIARTLAVPAGKAMNFDLE